MSLFVGIGPVLPDGSDGREIEFVSVILDCGDSRPVPSVDGLALLGGDGDPWSEDWLEGPQATVSRNDAATSEPEQMTRNNLTVTPPDASTEQSLQWLDK